MSKYSDICDCSHPCVYSFFQLSWCANVVFSLICSFALNAMMQWKFQNTFRFCPKTQIRINLNCIRAIATFRPPPPPPSSFFSFACSHSLCVRSFFFLFIFRLLRCIHTIICMYRCTNNTDASKWNERNMNRAAILELSLSNFMHKCESLFAIHFVRSEII